jgi:hypothetical protein
LKEEKENGRHTSILTLSPPQVPSLPATYGVNKLLNGSLPTSPPVHDNMSMVSGYSTVTGTVIGQTCLKLTNTIYKTNKYNLQN